MIRVRYSHRRAIAAINAAVEIRNNNQYKPLGLLFAMVQKNLRKSKVKALIAKGSAAFFVKPDRFLLLQRAACNGSV